MFSINKQTSYALLTIANLIDQKEYLPISDLIAQTKMPRRFLARVTAKLAKADILESKEGKTGGYILAKDLKEISLYEFLRVFEDDLKLVNCQKSDEKCCFKRICHHKDFFQNQLTDLLSKNLKSFTLADVFN